MDLPVPFALDDDHVGTRELRYEPPGPQRAAGDLVPRVLSYNGDGGRHRVTFDVSPGVFEALHLQGKPEASIFRTPRTGPRRRGGTRAVHASRGRTDRAPR
ncbi:hypothetical protein C5L38_02855 [Streptomyces sp. WAC00288]|uniref:Uncharacterized protein n=1 Tax=Streptomyces cinereoruber TaxID=67260 RepID=A0ABX6BPT3_9ACTN|nr:hypothetical protein C5L38_02855 [Streptomyces sp. WAC00288]KYG51449.1 hypothetical protein AWI43_28870 [Streptomyces sp. WAC04657]PVC76244.1 hypothetical protein DBP18_05800 [Streptomyces sp. CS081A]QEV36123.1 hypothetical protein CP977_31405 [Streptomyces cinereoruber]